MLLCNSTSSGQPPAEFNGQQGYARQRAQVQKLLIDATETGVQPAGNDCPEC